MGCHQASTFRGGSTGSLHRGSIAHSIQLAGSGVLHKNFSGEPLQTIELSDQNTGDALMGRTAEELLPSMELTLEVARRIAVVSNPDIHAAAARLDGAAAAVRFARAQYAPNVAFTHNTALTFQTPASRNRLGSLVQPISSVPADIDTDTVAVTTLLNALRRPLFGGSIGGGNTNPFSENSSSISVSWIAFDGFIREARLETARYLREAAELSLADVERLIVRAVDNAYFQVQLAEEQLRIAGADELFSQEQLTETEKLRDAGRATAADVANFRVRVLGAQADVTAAGGLRDTGRVVLAELLGIADTRLPGDLMLSPLNPETAEEMSSFQTQPWVDIALENRADVLRIERVVRSEEANLQAAKGQYLPSIIASGSWGFDHSSNLRYRAEDQSSALAVELRWELYTGGARRANVLQAQSVLAEAGATLRKLRLSIISQVRSAVINVHDAQEQIRLQRERLTVALENRRIIQAGYLAGKETLTRLNEAQRDFTAADANLTRARIRLRQAWSDLRTAAGSYIETPPAGSRQSSSPGP